MVFVFCLYVNIEPNQLSERNGSRMLLFFVLASSDVGIMKTIMPSILFGLFLPGEHKILLIEKVI